MLVIILVAVLGAGTLLHAGDSKLEVLAAQADTFLAQGEDAKALYALMEIERTDGTLFAINNYPYLAGVVAGRLGQLDLATTYLNRALDSRELNDYAAWALAGIAGRRGHLQESRDYLDRIMALRGSILASEAAYEHARTYIAENAFDKALAELSSPRIGSRDVIDERVRCLLGLGRLAEARRVTNEALKHHRRSDGVTRALGLLELNEGDEEIADLSTEEIRLRGDLYYTNRNFDRALFYYRILEEQRNVSDDWLLYSIGRSLDSSGSKAEALDWFEKSEKVVGSTYKFWTIWYQAEILFKRQDLTRAEERYMRSLPLAPSPQQDLSVRLRVLNCQELTGQRDRAAESMTMILQRHSSMLHLIKFRAIKGLIDEGKLADATALVDALFETAPSRSWQPELLFWKGWLLERQKNIGEAVAAYDTILRLDPRDFYAQLAADRVAAMPGDIVASGYREGLAEARRLVQAGHIDEARRQLSYLYHRYPANHGELAGELAGVYARLPRYRDFLSLTLLPRRPLLTLRGDQSVSRTRAGELAFLGFFGDAAKEMDAARGRRLVSLPTLLTISDSYQRGGLAYMAMLRAESLAGLLPRDYEFDLLPRRLQQLLYPVNFTTFVDRYAPSDLDRPLFYALVREESRFNTLARSPAGARGLLQFLPSTAWAVLQEVGGSSLHDEDLYDAELSIKLGTYYIAKLARQFTPSLAPLLACYNAGEEQGKLWLRMAGTGEIHRYLTEVNYPETRTYIERIVVSYDRYRSVYPELIGPVGTGRGLEMGAGGPSGGPPAVHGDR